jgi:hypothetical protein
MDRYLIMSDTLDVLLSEMQTKSKYVNPWVILVQTDSVDELTASLLNKVILEEDGESYEVTRMGRFTGVVDSMTPNRCFLMSHDEPFQRVYKTQSPKALLETLPPGRMLVLCQVERVPWKFDPSDRVL